ncbi:uncharacterized protein LOC126897674 [Daktulosphaira vitifoliae]|uniref:uncharacterized protein LOC126897674 n=1 Tax=Daktulosphaira vitifoliae TaxID=58002 RepID=UPI0021AA2D33|nr:uncharacterized protein LOC126897674 [Daktulosphaira vitifoliae]
MYLKNFIFVNFIYNVVIINAGQCYSTKNNDEELINLIDRVSTMDNTTDNNTTDNNITDNNTTDNNITDNNTTDNNTTENFEDEINGEFEFPTLILEENLNRDREWKLYPRRQDSFTLDFLQALSTTITYESDKILITNNDIRLLSEIVEFNEERLKLLEKIKTKMEALQCVYAFTVLGYLHLFASNYSKIKILEIGNYLKLIFSIFYEVKVSVHKYFWLLHIRIAAYDTCYSDQDPKFFFFDLSNHIQNMEKLCESCVEKTYLKYNTDIQVIMEQSSIDFEVLVNTIPNIHNHFILRNYKLDDLAELISYICKPNGPINWTKVMEWIKYSRSEIILSSINGDWNRDPYRNIKYQTLLLRVIYANVLYHVLIHLKSYSYNLMFYGDTNRNPIIAAKLKQFWVLLKEPLMTAIKLLDVYSGIIWSLWYHMMSEDIEILTIDDMIQYLDVKLSEELKNLGVDESHNLLKEFEIIQIDETTDIDSELVKNNTTSLQKYLTKIEKRINPINFYLIRFFLNGQYN